MANLFLVVIQVQETVSNSKCLFKLFTNALNKKLSSKYVSDVVCQLLVKLIIDSEVLVVGFRLIACSTDTTLVSATRVITLTFCPQIEPVIINVCFIN